MTKVAVLGTGHVGQVLAKGFKELGDDVTLASRDGKQVEGWEGSVATFVDAAKNSELVVLAVKGTAADELVGTLKQDLTGKVVIDTTNPIADAPPEDGVLKYFTSFDESLMERLQSAAPEAKFVKAFNSVGAGNMVHPKYEVKPTMFICGNDSGAKQQVTELLDKFGWETVDMGTVKAARAIEPLCMLYCIPGLLQNQWTHAFKLLQPSE